MRQRSRRRAAAANRVRKTARVCIGDGSSVFVRDNLKAVSASDKDRRRAARRRTGRKKSMIGTSM